MRDKLLLRGGKLQEEKPDSDDSDFSANMDVASEQGSDNQRMGRTNAREAAHQENTEEVSEVRQFRMNFNKEEESKEGTKLRY